MLKNAVRLVMTGVIAVPLYLLLGWGFMTYLSVEIGNSPLYMVIGIVAAILLGFLIAHFLLILLAKLFTAIRTTVENITIQEMFGGVLGVVIGLLLAILLGNSIYKLPYVGPYFYVVVALFMAYLGWVIGTKRREDVSQAFSGLKVKKKEGSSSRPSKTSQPGSGTNVDKLVDTSVIIDGRIYDIAKSGFLDGALIIPKFVLEELQKIADSSDSMKRNRGRSGLDVLNRLRTEDDIYVDVRDQDYPDIAEVDAKLVKMGQDLGLAVLTNDYNLNKVAQLQGVKVLNINELSNALKPVVLPGEEFSIKIIKEGKEAEQGIGYLDDGTMVVVERGRNLVGKTKDVEVTSVLQTAAGRMIFAKPRS